MKKKKASLNVAEISDKGKDPNEEMRGRIVEKGIPLWLQNDRKRHVQFKAGKMYVMDNMVHADPRKGYICIEQDRYQVMHFCWMERDALGTKEDDFTPERYDSIFKRVPKCTTGRVYIMKIRSTNKNYFYWMQEPEAEMDTALVAKVNYLMNFPPAWLTFPQIVLNMSGSETSYESPESDEQEDSEEEAEEEEQTEDRIEMESSQEFTKILQDVLPGFECILNKKKDRKTRTSEDSHSPELFSTPRAMSDIITPDSLRSIMGNANYMKQLEDTLPILEDGTREDLGTPMKAVAEMFARANVVRNLDSALKGFERSTIATARLGSCRNVANMLSDDSDSEYADAVEGEDMDYWVSGPEYGTVSISGTPPNDANQWSPISKVMDAALARNIEAELNCGENEAVPTGKDKPQQHYKAEDGAVASLTGSRGNQSRESTSGINIAVDFSDHETKDGAPRKKEASITQPILDLGHSSRDTTIMADGAKNDTRISNNARRVLIFHDGKIHRTKISLNKTKSSTEPAQGTLLVGEGLSHETQEHDDENIEHDVKKKVYGKPGPLKDGDSWNATKAVTLLAATLGDKLKNELNSRVTRSTTESRNKPLQHRAEDAGCSMESHLDQPEPGNETLEKWESTAGPNFQLEQNDEATLGRKENDGQTANNITTKDTSKVEKYATGETLLNEMQLHEEETKGLSVERPGEHVIANVATLQTGSPGFTVAAAPPRFRSIRQSQLLYPHESKSTGVSVETGAAEESSTPTSTDDLPECLKMIPPPLESSRCGAEVLDSPTPSSSKLKSILEQPGCSNVLKPMPFELHGLDTKSRDTVLSMFPSFVTFSNSSVSEDRDEDDSNVEETPDCPKRRTSIQDEDGEATETVEIKKDTTESSDGEELHEKYDTSLVDGASTDNIAMMALVQPVGSDKTKVDAKKPIDTVSSGINESPQSATLDSDPNIHNSGNNNQANEVTGSVSGQISGSAASSGGGLREQEPAKANNDLPDSQKASSSSVHGAKNPRGKTVVRNLSKSLQEVACVSGPHKEVTCNLRKRPQPSLSGPAVAGSGQGRDDKSSKRPRVSSPGMQPPLPFRVPDANPARSTRSRTRQVSASPLLQSPNQVEGGNGRTLRKRPNDDETDSALEEPPTKKPRTSDGNNSTTSKAGPSRQLGHGPAPGSKPASSSGGSGSIPGSLTLNKTSASRTNKTASHDSSQSADTSPRYNLRSRSAKIETEPVKIREIRNARPETVIRARTVSRLLPGPPVNRTNRDRSQNTRPVIIEDKNSSKSKPNGPKPSDSNP